VQVYEGNEAVAIAWVSSGIPVMKYLTVLAGVKKWSRKNSYPLLITGITHLGEVTSDALKCEQLYPVWKLSIHCWVEFFAVRP